MLCLSLLGLLLAGCSGDETPAPVPTAIPTTAEVTAAPQPELDYPELEARLDGEVLSRVYTVDGAVFLPMHSLCERLGFELSFEGDESKLEAKLGEAEISASAGQSYMTADGRYLYIPEGWIAEDGGLWLSEDAACRLLGLRASIKDGAVILDGSGAKMLRGGEDYYDIHFDMEQTYWLPQIINAEAMGQPLEGMIGVGNVVMNRVASDEFPDDIFSVIYDMEHVVQFEPVSNGSIKAEPCEEAYIAAYLCLEGYNTVGDSLYFVNPAYGSGWFDTALELYKAIGDHNFYTSPEE